MTIPRCMRTSVRSGRSLPRAIIGGMALGVIALACGWTLYANLAASRGDAVLVAPPVLVKVEAPAAAFYLDPVLLDPRRAIGFAPRSFAESVPRPAEFRFVARAPAPGEAAASESAGAAAGGSQRYRAYRCRRRAPPISDWRSSQSRWRSEPRQPIRSKSCSARPRPPEAFSPTRRLSARGPTAASPMTSAASRSAARRRTTVRPRSTTSRRARSTCRTAPSWKLIPGSGPRWTIRAT